MKKVKTQIKDYRISKDNKLVTLAMEDLDKDDDSRFFSLAVLYEELGPMFQIGVIESNDLAVKLLEGVKGKPFYMEVHPTITDIDTDKFKSDKLGNDAVMSGHQKLDYYPYHEVLKELSEGEDDS